MYNRRSFRIVVCIVSLCALIGALLLFLHRDARRFMNVEFMTAQDFPETSAYTYEDLSGRITFRGEPAAIDVEKSVILVPENFVSDARHTDAPGELAVTNPEYQMYFLEDPYFDKLDAAVRENHHFELIVFHSSERYMKYDVVFTSLPVLRMNGGVAYTNEEQRDVLRGSMSLWVPANERYNPQYMVSSYNLEWHLRGRSSTALNKKSWKLSLKKENGRKRNDDLLSLGRDDDWLLNATVLDDTKIREKLFMDLWNRNAAATDYNVKMSEGEYVEVVINGRYEGVYLMMRRLDGRYLDLGPEDVLLKTTAYAQPTVQRAYDIVYSNLSDDESYHLIEGLFLEEDYSSIDIDNFIDVNLFLMFASAADNFGSQNIYHLFQWTDENKYVQKMIPWDTDMSFGLNWGDHGFYHDDKIVHTIQFRQELENLEILYPDCMERMAERWKVLRRGVLSNESVFSEIEGLMSELQNSGAVARDHEQWGCHYENDTVTRMQSFIRERLSFLDQYFGM